MRKSEYPILAALEFHKHGLQHEVLLLHAHCGCGHQLLAENKVEQRS